MKRRAGWLGGGFASGGPRVPRAELLPPLLRRSGSSPPFPPAETQGESGGVGGGAVPMAWP